MPKDRRSGTYAFSKKNEKRKMYDRREYSNNFVRFLNTPVHRVLPRTMEKILHLIA